MRNLINFLMFSDVQALKIENSSRKKLDSVLAEDLWPRGRSAIPVYRFTAIARIHTIKRSEHVDYESQ